jgi:hypothetical protein
MGDDPHLPWGRALYHLPCSEFDNAAEWFEKMIELRDPAREAARVFGPYEARR